MTYLLFAYFMDKQKSAYALITFRPRCIWARISENSKFDSRIDRTIVVVDFEWNLIVLAKELPLIDSLKKISSTVPGSNFPVNNVHSEDDYVRFASPKSDFPCVDEDIGIFSWNGTLLRP
jgi:hypothetical protein